MGYAGDRVHILASSCLHQTAYRREDHLCCTEVCLVKWIAIWIGCLGDHRRYSRSFHRGKHQENESASANSGSAFDHVENRDGRHRSGDHCCGTKIANLFRQL